MVEPTGWGVVGVASSLVVVTSIISVSTVALARFLKSKHKEVSVSAFLRMAMILQFSSIILANYASVAWGIALLFAIGLIFFI